MNFKPQDRTSEYLFTGLLLCLFLVIGVFVGSVFFPHKDPGSQLLSATNGSTGISKLNDIVKILQSKYYYQDRLDSSKIVDSTVKGFLSGLDDAPTRYLNSQEYAQYKNLLSGDIFGIGIELGGDDQNPKIFNVYVGSPAEKAGVLKDDIILKVDNKAVSGLSLGEIATLIRGVQGSTVKLTLQRGNDIKEFTIQRDKIHTDSVTFAKTDVAGVCRINIVRFTDDSVEKWRSYWDSAVNQFTSNNCQKLVLDIRNNGGGYVLASKYAIEEFIPDGTYIYGQKKSNGTIDKINSSRDGDIGKGLYAGTKGRLRNTPVVILINSNSASASEILAGSLQVQNKAKLVGINSYGKGSVQEENPFSDGSALILTIANWTLPNDQVIDANYPIRPDYVIVPTTDDLKSRKDVQLEKATDLLK